MRSIPLVSRTGLVPLAAAATLVVLSAAALLTSPAATAAQDPSGQGQRGQPTADGETGDKEARDAGVEAVEAALMRIYRKVTVAAQKADVATMDRYFADGCVITDPEGKMKSKPEILNFYRDGGKAPPVAFSGMTVRVFGDRGETAVVTYIIRGLADGVAASAGGQAGEPSGETSGETLFATDTWVRQGGLWQKVAAQASLLPRAVGQENTPD